MNGKHIIILLNFNYEFVFSASSPCTIVYTICSWIYIFRINIVADNIAKKNNSGHVVRNNKSNIL